MYLFMISELYHSVSLKARMRNYILGKLLLFFAILWTSHTTVIIIGHINIAAIAVSVLSISDSIVSCAPAISLLSIDIASFPELKY